MQFSNGLSRQGKHSWITVFRGVQHGRSCIEVDVIPAMHQQLTKPRTCCEVNTTNHLSFGYSDASQAARSRVRSSSSSHRTILLFSGLYATECAGFFVT